jgi:hypothetical protein
MNEAEKQRKEELESFGYSIFLHNQAKRKAEETKK